MDNQNMLSVVENFSDIGIEMSEVIIDSLLSEGVLKDIPLVGTLVSAFRAGKQIKDILYLERLKAFVYGYAQLPEKIGENILSDLDDPEKRKDLGVKILLVIESVDTITKAELIGKAFKLLKNDEIKSPFFLRLCHRINKSYYDDLLFLTCFTSDDMNITTNNDKMDNSVLEELFSNGWLNNMGVDGGNAYDEGGTIYGLNEYGLLMKRILN